MPDPNMFDLKPYLTVIGSLLGGGLMGALVTAGITSYRSRLQPVGRRIEIDPILRPKPEGTTLTAKITVEYDYRPHTFDNLFLARIQIVNQGNKDHDEFSFGITLPTEDFVVYLEGSGADRHHVIAPSATVTPANPAREVDFICKPFSRGDSYTLSAFIVTTSEEGPGDIAVSSKLPVRFVEIPSLGETLGQAITVASIFSLGFGRFLNASIEVVEKKTK
jgi:hypothetical protein